MPDGATLILIFGAHMIDHPEYMLRCLELAKRGSGSVAPNPMVGAILVNNNRIIGEGWHEAYGEAHAEVNCINDAIRNGFSDVIQQSELYVSLEPCAHTGKTPPCADLIIRHKIPRVFIGCRDPFPLVNGKGIEKLEEAGVHVILAGHELENACRQLNHAFFTFHTKERPYIILKWAQTADGFMGSGDHERLMISNEFSNRLVHQWRSEAAGILAGTNTIILDDPALTTRSWPGRSPVRLVLDMKLRIPAGHRIFNDEAATIVLNGIRHEMNGFHPRARTGLWYCKITGGSHLPAGLVKQLHLLQIQSVIVEGGRLLLQSFIDAGFWDEARIITNQSLQAGKGIPTPGIIQMNLIDTTVLGDDQVRIYIPVAT